MHDHDNEEELKDRLTLIENMIAEGRRQTESWGWTFVLWGLAYYGALAWSTWGHSTWAWPVSMSVAIVITVVVASMRGSKHPGTTLGRAMGSLWMALGISMFLLFLGLGVSGRLTDQHVFVAVVSAMLGMANGASGLLLRWRAQLVCAVVWWAAAVGSSFGTDEQNTIMFLVAIFLCQIVFGVYAMISDAQQRKGRAPIYA